MRRVAAIVVGAGLVLVVGCGTQNYEYRLEHTLEEMRYQRRLNENLNEPATKGKLEELQIYLRPPKNMTGPAQTFQLAAVEPGRFDVESSFTEPEKQSLHVLARVKRPKTPAKKGAAQAEPPPRGDFNTEVVDLIKNVYGAELATTDFKDDTKGTNTFKYKLLDLNAKNVQIYLYGNKNSPHEVALIFEYPKAEHNSVNPKIGLCLESFAVGEKARRAFAGGEVEEGAGGSGQRGSTAAHLIGSGCILGPNSAEIGPAPRGARLRVPAPALHRRATVSAAAEPPLRRRPPGSRKPALIPRRARVVPRESTRLEGS